MCCSLNLPFLVFLNKVTLDRDWDGGEGQHLASVMAPPLRHTVSGYLNTFTFLHHIMPINHLFIAKDPHFMFLPVSPTFCWLKLCGLNRFLSASLNWSGRNQTTLLCRVNCSERARKSKSECLTIQGLSQFLSQTNLLLLLDCEF